MEGIASNHLDLKRREIQCVDPRSSIEANHCRNAGASAGGIQSVLLESNSRQGDNSHRASIGRGTVNHVITLVLSTIMKGTKP
jgi:hypothetical protein